MPMEPSDHELSLSSIPSRYKCCSSTGDCVSFCMVLLRSCMVKSSGKSSVKISGSIEESFPLSICIEMRGLLIIRAVMAVAC